MTTNFPAISWGNHIDDAELVVLRVDEGRFRSTIWSYVDVGPVPVGDNEYVVNYQCDFAMFVVDGILQETPDPAALQEFYDTVATPFLSHSIESAKAAPTDS